MEYFEYKLSSFTIPDQNGEYSLNSIEGIIYNKKLSYGAGWIFRKKDEMKIIDLIKKKGYDPRKRESKPEPEIKRESNPDLIKRVSNERVSNISESNSKDMTLETFLNKYPDLIQQFKQLSFESQIQFIRKLTN